jgi:hypothetical protein
MIVAIRIKTQGNLAFRTTYPLSEEQLDDYIKSDTVWKIKKCINNCVDKCVDKYE